MTCECVLQDSDDIEHSGTGEPGNPYLLTHILDPDPDNLLVISSDGLNMPLPPELENPPSTRTQRGNAQVISNNTLTTVLFDDTRWDTWDDWNIGQNSRLTASVQGLYLIEFSAVFEKDTDAGYREIRIDHSVDGEIATWVVKSVFDIDTIIRVVTMWRVDAGEYVEAKVRQTSGSSLNLESRESYSPDLTWVRLPAQMGGGS